MSEEFVFDLTPTEIPVTIGGVKYLLREADEATAAEFRNQQIKGGRFERSGDNDLASIVPDNLADTESFLVGRCLYREKDAGDGCFPDPIGQKTVKSWPHRVVRPLFDKAMVISGLKEEEKGNKEGKTSEDEDEDPTSD